VADKRKKNEKSEAKTEEATEIKDERSIDATETETGEPVEETIVEPDDSVAESAEDTIDETVDEPEIVADDPVETPEPDMSDLNRDEFTPLPVVAPDPVVISKGGFFPMLLGGIVAAVIGFGVAVFLGPDGWPWATADDDAFQAEVTATLETQSKSIADLQAEAGKAPDFAPLEDQIAGVQSSVDTLSEQIAIASTRLDAFDTRLSDLESRPVTESASPAAVAAYERELKALQDAMAAQRAEIEKVATEAAEKEANAEATAQQAMLQAALSQIQTSLDTGTGYSDAINTLKDAGIAVPGELAKMAADGVATRRALAQSFPEAARAALTVARKNEDGGGGLGGFLKTQLGVRSTEPREGNDADAILSRAEAAVNEGRLTDALAELEALPEGARAEMTDWLGRAESRAAALKAADALASELN